MGTIKRKNIFDSILGRLPDLTPVKSLGMSGVSVVAGSPFPKNLNRSPTGFVAVYRAQDLDPW